MKSGVIVLIFLAIAIVAAGSYFLVNSYDSNDDGVVCTQDAQLCPDGSYVGRNPDNNCEFFACPAANNTNFTGEGNDIAYVIEISGFAFSEKTLTINVGESVTWMNKDSTQHTVTSDSGSELDSQYLSKGSTYSHVFTTAGTYAYHCTPHPGMKGTIIVR